MQPPTLRSVLLSAIFLSTALLGLGMETGAYLCLSLSTGLFHMSLACSLAQCPDGPLVCPRLGHLTESASATSVKWTGPGDSTGTGHTPQRDKGLSQCGPRFQTPKTRGVEVSLGRCEMALRGQVREADRVRNKKPRGRDGERKRRSHGGDRELEAETGRRRG